MTEYCIFLFLYILRQIDLFYKIYPEKLATSHLLICFSEYNQTGNLKYQWTDILDIIKKIITQVIMMIAANLAEE